MTLVQVVLEGRTLSSMALSDWSLMSLLGALWILQPMDSMGGQWQEWGPPLEGSMSRATGATASITHSWETDALLPPGLGGIQFHGDECSSLASS